MCVCCFFRVLAAIVAKSSPKPPPPAPVAAETAARPVSSHVADAAPVAASTAAAGSASADAMQRRKEHLARQRELIIAKKNAEREAQLQQYQKDNPDVPRVDRGKALVEELTGAKSSEADAAAAKQSAQRAALTKQLLS